MKKAIEEDNGLDAIEMASSKSRGKLLSVPSELPIGMFDKETAKWYRGFEITKMHSDTLVKFERDENPYKTFGNIVAKSLLKIYDTETGEELPNWKQKTSKLFFPDTFFLMIEIIIATKGTSLVPTVYKCPSCGKFTKFENPVGESLGVDSPEGFDLTADADEMSSLEMEDVRSIKLNLERGLEKPELYFHFDDGVEIGGERFTEYVFRIPEIGDYIMKSGGQMNSAGEKNVLSSCLISINGATGKDLTMLKAKYGTNLMGFDVKDYMKIVTRLNRIGYDYGDHKVTCSHCGLDFKTGFDITNFFGSLLGR